MSIEKILAETNFLSASTKLVLVTLLSVMQNNGCSPSVKKLAELTGLSGSTIRRALKELEKANIISIYERYNDDGGRASNELVINQEKGII